MKKSRIFLAVVGFMLLATGVAIFESHHHQVSDPIYEGKHLSEWLNSLDKNGVYGGGGPYFPKIDSNAMPMIAAYWEPESKLRRRYINFYESTSPQVRKWIPYVHRKFPVCLGLVDLFSHRKEDNIYIVPILARVLESSNERYLRCFAAQGLGKMVVDETNALAALKVAETDSNAIIKSEARNALARITARQIRTAKLSP